MFPNQLSVAFCVVCLLGTFFGEEALHAQTDSTKQPVAPVARKATDLVAELATADQSTHAEILEQLKVIDLPSIVPLIKLTSPSLKLDPLTRWQAVLVLHHRYTVGDAKQLEAIGSPTVQGKLNQCALEVCAVWQKQGPGGLASLLAAVESPIDPLSNQALFALRKYRELPPEALDQLQKMKPKQSCAMDWALLLGKHGRVSVETVPGLIAGLYTRRTASCMYCISGTQRDESGQAEAALAKMDSATATAAAPQLLAALTSVNDQARPAVIAAVGKIEGPAAFAAIPQLIESLRIENRDVRAAAAEVLGKIGPSAKEAIPALIAARDCKIVRPAPRGAMGFFGPPAPQTFAIPAEATWALARIQAADAKDDPKPAAQATAEQTDPDVLTKTLPGVWKIEITISPKLLQRPIQEVREYLYMIVTVQGGFQAQECQVKISANGLALIQLPKITDTEKKSEPEQLPVSWKVSKHKDGLTTLVVNHAGVGDLLFRGSLRQLDANTVECQIMAQLRSDKPEEPSLPLLIAKLQRVQQ